MLEYWPQGLQIVYYFPCLIFSQIGLPNLMLSFFQPWEHPQHLVVTWGILKSFFFYFSLDSDVKPLGLISTFALRGMLDLCETLAVTRSVKRA